MFPPAYQEYVGVEDRTLLTTDVLERHIGPCTVSARARRDVLSILAPVQSLRARHVCRRRLLRQRREGRQWEAYPDLSAALEPRDSRGPDSGNYCGLQLPCSRTTIVGSVHQVLRDVGSVSTEGLLFRSQTSMRDKTHPGSRPAPPAYPPQRYPPSAFLTRTSRESQQEPADLGLFPRRR